MRIEMAWLAWVLSALCASCTPYSVAPLSQEAYVWKRAWSPEVGEAMSASATYFEGFRLLVAEADRSGRWRLLAPTRTLTPPQAAHAMTAVFRIDGRGSLAHPQETVGVVQAFLHSPQAVRWSRVEIDYDCASAQLADYAEFVALLRRAMAPGLRLSVTVLPTWMASPRLPELLAAADESVLQVHSVLDPHRGLFDRRLAAGWIERYARIARKPFFVALPDYGSRVEWRADGHLSRVVSEQLELGSDLAATDLSATELEADPTQVERLLVALRDRHPAHLAGIVWFRLPVASDVRIWSLATLEAVMEGRPLRQGRQTLIERDALGAYRIIVRNVGDLDLAMPQAVHIAPCSAADALSVYEVSHAATQTSFVRRGHATLRAGNRAEIGWTRCAVRPEEVSFED